MPEKLVLKNKNLYNILALTTFVCVVLVLYIICIKIPLIPIKLNYTIQFQQWEDNRIKKKTQLKLVIPFYHKQIDKVLDSISKWKIYQPCSQTTSTNLNVELLFYVGYLNADPDIEKKLSSISNDSMKCFSGKHLVFFKYDSRDENEYIKGARLMFESMLNKSNEHFKDTNFVFYMEPDVRPVKSDWVNALVNEIGSGKFWIKGSFFRGDMKQLVKNSPYIPTYVHINGNALYNIGSDEFTYFYFNILRPYVVKKHGDSKVAYDTDFFEFFLDMNNYDTTRNVIHQFHFSDFIQNYWHTDYKISDFEKNYPDTYFVHGGVPSY